MAHDVNCILTCTYTHSDMLYQCQGLIILVSLFLDQCVTCIKFSPNFQTIPDGWKQFSAVIGLRISRIIAILYG